MRTQRIQDIQTLIDRHYPAANRIDVDMGEGNPHLTTFKPPSVRDRAIYAFNELLDRHGDVAAVTLALENAGMFGNVVQGREKICYIEDVIEAFQIVCPEFGIGDRYSPLSSFDMSMGTGRFLAAKRYSEVWGVSVHSADRALWEYGRGQAENAERYIEAGRRELREALADTGINPLGARPYTLS